MQRRQFGIAAAGALGAPFMGRVARAQTPRPVIFIAFAGGTAAAWQQCYATPYQKQTGIPVKVVEVSDPTPWFLGRPTEFDATVSQAIDYPLYQQGKIEPFVIADYPVLKDIPEDYWSKVDDKRIMGMPVYWQAYGIAINRRMVKPGEITSWFDLADPKYKGKIATNRFSEVYDLPWFAKISGGSEANQEPGFDLYRKILANSLTIPASMAQTLQLLQNGDVVAAAFYSARIWTLKKSGDSSLDFVLPKEGGPLISYHVELSKRAPNLDGAKQFAAFSAEPGPSQQTADLVGYFPVHKDAKYPADFADLMGMPIDAFKAKLRPMDYAAIGRTRQDMRDRLDEINAEMKH